MFEAVQHHRNKAVTWGLVVALAASLAFAVGQGTVEAKHSDGHQPANKVAVAGSEIEEHAPGEEVVLLETTMRNAASKSLVLQVTLECSILTDLVTEGNDEARAESTLDVWVEIDGEKVAVADHEGAGDGEVTFCNREYQRETIFAEDEEATIDDHIATKQAHGFNWVALEPGQGVKHIEVKGNLETDEVGTATATLTVGNRTLVVEPVDTAHGETRDN